MSALLLALVVCFVAVYGQKFDLEAIYRAVPKPTTSVPVVYVTDVSASTTATAMTVSFAASQAQLAVVSDILANHGSLDRRAPLPTLCIAQPTGISHNIQPDTDSAFLADPYYTNAALRASAPNGYSTAFVNLNASSSAYGYLGYTTLSDYDVRGCSVRCDAIAGCQSFNICKSLSGFRGLTCLIIVDFERDPSVNPDSSSCANPGSTVQIKVRSHPLVSALVLKLIVLVRVLGWTPHFKRCVKSWTVAQ